MAKGRKLKRQIPHAKRSDIETIHQKTSTEKHEPQANPTALFPIVGIGASAGGLEAIKEILQQLPIDTGMAFILVQHLDPTHESLAPEILSRATRMPVNEVKDGMRVEPNHVYMIPPNFDMVLLQNVLSLLPLRSGSRGQHLVIDSFLQSLASDQKSRAIGVILSGTASDGTQGIKAIKSEGGLAIAQDPQTAKYGGMPESAIASGFVDLILPPSEIAKELARISKHPYVAAACNLTNQSDATAVDEDEIKEVIQPGPAEGLRKIFVILRAQTQVDFSNYKRSTIMRRIQRRMMVRKSENIDAYAKYLQDNPNEVKALYTDILIHVTEFFRDPNSFKALQEQVFPQLIKNRSADSPIRIWVPGCSTGEEAYSIAILLLEFLNHAGAKIPIQMFATDISDQAVQKARAGVYPSAIENTVNKDRLKLFFEKVEGGYKIQKSLRDLCLFSKHDVTNDPPFSKLDLVSCRNVLIYFSTVLQKRVIPIFHYALNPGGFLWLGKSESPGAHSKLFGITDKTHKIYTKINVPTPMTLRAPVIYDQDIRNVQHKMPEKIKIGGDFQREAERILLSKYSPPSVIIDADMEIVQFQGRTAPYLEQVSGAATLNVIKMARKELAHGLRATIQSTIKKNASTRLEGLSFDIDGKRKHLNIEALPVNPSVTAKQRNYLIVFEETASAPIPRQAEVSGAKKGIKKTAPDKQGQRIRELEDDLAANQLSQKALSEEFETAQEELTSANEELQSTNEELQSTNEELETSKEELQSSNEELSTVNDELQTRNADLVILSSDLNNVLNNVEMPVVIVGGDRRIRRFTAKAERYFNLISGDVGRPLSDIKPNFESDLAAMVSRAIETLKLQECEIHFDQSHWMRLQVQPYRTVDDRIDGAVITLVDITFLKQNLTTSQDALKYETSVANTLRLPLVVLDDQLCLLSANHGFANRFKIDPRKETGRNLFSIIGGQGWNVPRLRELLIEVVSKDHELTDFEVEHEFPELGHRIMLLNARQISWEGPATQKALLLSIDDITERRTLERALEQSEDRFRKVVESAHDAILLVNSQGIIKYANNRVYKWFGYDAGELEGKPYEILLPERIRSAHQEYHKKYTAAPIARPMGAGLELFARRKDGTEMPVDISISPIKKGNETKTTVIIRDISETKKLSAEREILLDHEREARREADRAKVDAEFANASKDIFLAVLSHELRTPLASILSWAQLLQREELASEKLRHGLQTMERSAKTQGQLIDDLLDVARIQSGKLATKFADIDIREPVRLAIEAVRSLAENKHIAVESEINLESEIIWGDPDRIQQIVWNLLTNAIKFSPENGRIQVRVEAIEDENKKLISIKIIDHGKGIKSEFLPKIFDRFSQADSSSIREHGGLGLGLALVRDLTQIHGGSVRAESDGEDKGSTFTILIPIKSEGSTQTVKIAPKEKADSIRPNLLGLCVMIVEDDPDTMEIINETLVSFGAHTVQYGTVADALKAFAKSNPDVLVSDIAMPVEDGYSLIQKIRKLGPEKNGDVPSLALSAYASEGDVERAMAAGFNSHMAKPFDSHRFGRAVAELAKNRKRGPRQ